MDDERKEYLKQYKKNNLKRISLDVKGDFYEQVKLAAKIDGVSVSRYIKGLIAKDINVKQDTVAYRIAINKKNQVVGSPLDYFKRPPKQELEKVIFDSYDITGRYTGKAVALLTPEEAEKYREAQKEKASQDKT